MKDWEFDAFKRKQRSIFYYAVFSGKVKRMPCSICGKPNAHGHHPDYEKPLEVVWLCHYHHKEEHVRLGSYDNWWPVHIAMLAKLEEGEQPNCNAWKTKPRQVREKKEEIK